MKEFEECASDVTTSIVALGVTLGWWTVHGVRDALTRNVVFRLSVTVEPIQGVTVTAKRVEVTL